MLWTKQSSCQCLTILLLSVLLLISLCIITGIVENKYLLQSTPIQHTLQLELYDDDESLNNPTSLVNNTAMIMLDFNITQRTKTIKSIFIERNRLELKKKSHRLSTPNLMKKRAYITSKRKKKLKQKKKKNRKRKVKQLFIPFYIFQIGFNKAGTRALWQFFGKNGIYGVHCDQGQLYQSMQKNYDQNKPLLSDYNLQYKFFGDFVAYHQLLSDNQTGSDKTYLYHILLQQYQDSKFILNIRHINHYVKSKYMHFSWTGKTGFLIDRFRRNNRTDIECINKWIYEWYEYLCNVINYFNINEQISDNLLIFDIEKDSITKVTEYFAKFGVKLNGKYWRVKGNTSLVIKSKQSEYLEYAEEIELQYEKWHNLTLKYPQLLYDDAYDNKTEYQRIMEYCSVANMSLILQQALIY